MSKNFLSKIDAQVLWSREDFYVPTLFEVGGDMATPDVVSVHFIGLWCII